MLSSGRIFRETFSDGFLGYWTIGQSHHAWVSRQKVTLCRRTRRATRQPIRRYWPDSRFKIACGQVVVYYSPEISSKPNDNVSQEYSG